MSLPDPSCALTTGDYYIQSNEDYFGVYGNKVVINNAPKRFHVRRVHGPPKCTYEITVVSPTTSYKFVQDKEGEVIVGSFNQRWVITKHQDRYNVALEDNTNNVWTDPGGAPGPRREIYIDVLEVGNDDQLFSFFKAT